MLILLLLLLSCFVFFEISFKDISMKFYYGLIVLIALVEGIRWYSGVDFFMYYNSYQKLLNITEEFHNKRYDFLYFYFSKFFKITGFHYTFFLLVISLVCWLLQGRFIEKYTRFPILALTINFVCLIGFLGNNRQLIALSLVFFATHFLINGKKLIFSLFVLLASGFHFTSIVLLIFLFLNQEISFKKWFLFAFLVVLTCFLPFEDIVLKCLQQQDGFFYFLKERFTAYKKLNKDNIDFVFFGLGFLRKCLPILILLLFRLRLKELKGYTFFLNVSILSLLIYVWSNFSFTYLLGRFTIYFSIYECIIYSWVPLLLVDQKQKIKLITFILFSFFYVVLFFKGISSYYELFIPYRTIFFKF